MRTLVLSAVAAAGLSLAGPSTAAAQYVYDASTGQYYSQYTPYAGTAQSYYPNTGYTYYYSTPNRSTMTYYSPGYTTYYNPGYSAPRPLGYNAGGYAYPYSSAYMNSYGYSNWTGYPRYDRPIDRAISQAWWYVR
jgi:hypothetical protein